MHYIVDVYENYIILLEKTGDGGLDFNQNFIHSERKRCSRDKF